MMKLITRAQANLNSLRSEDGNAAEYGLIIAGVAVVIIAGLAVLAAAPISQLVHPAPPSTNPASAASFTSPFPIAAGAIIAMTR